MSKDIPSKHKPKVSRSRNIYIKQSNFKTKIENIDKNYTIFQSYIQHEYVTTINVDEPNAKALTFIKQFLL
jgi:hypothetical protein